MPIINQAGEVLSVLVSAQDITERKRAETAMRRSRDNLLRITERVPVMLARLDKKQVLRFVNPAFGELIGRDPAVVTGQPVDQAFPAPIYGQLEPIIKRLLSGAPDKTGLESLDLDQNGRHLQISFAPEIDARQRVTGLALAIVDVSERHAGWQMAARNEARLRRILDNVLAFVGTLNTDGVLTEANEPAIVAAGLRREDVVGQPFWECYWWSHSPQVQQALREAVAQAAAGKTVRYDTEVRVNGDQRMMIDFQLSPVFDEAGEVLELIPSGVDISVRHAAQAELAASLQRMRQMMSAAQVGIAFGDQSGRMTQANDAMLNLLQRSRSSLNRGEITWDEHSLARDRQSNLLGIQTLSRAGRIEPTEKTLVRTDGTKVPVLVSAALTDSRAHEHVAFVVDMGAQRRAEAQARADRIALQKVYNTAPVGLAYFDADLRYRFINEKLAAINGASVEAHLGRTTAELHPKIFSVIEPHVRRMLETGEPLLGVELHETDALRGGGEHWWLANWIPDLDEHGRFVGMHVSVQEITELKNTEAHRELLLAELNHRVKNSLATIQAIASNTLRDTTDPTVFRDAFMGRLRAIAAAHDVLIASTAGRVDVRELVASQLSLFVHPDSDRVRMDGPDVRLSAPVAHALVLVLHELATNAIKYGALSGQTGSVHVDWSMLAGESPARVQIEWQELGGPPVRTPSRKGFGTRLIESSMSYTLGGETVVHYNVDGVSAIIRIPVEADYE